jgi:hypothetical protein
LVAISRYQNDLGYLTKDRIGKNVNCDGNIGLLFLVPTAVARCLLAVAARTLEV